MGYPTSLITDTTPGVDIYPPQNGQAMGTYNGAPVGTANPDHPTWLKRLADEVVAIEAGLGLPSNPAAGSVWASMLKSPTNQSFVVNWDSSHNQSVKVIDSVNSRSVVIDCHTVEMIEGGGVTVGVGGTSSLANGQRTLGVGFAGIHLGGGFPISAQIVLDQTSGDIFAVGVDGPNAGKKVNLTAGKWA